MKLTGLEEVKAQVPKTKARTDTVQRQNTNIKDETYSMVLLGNHGTDETRYPTALTRLLTAGFSGKTAVFASTQIFLLP